MMGWRPWAPSVSRKFQVWLTVHRLEFPEDAAAGGRRTVAAEVVWKGRKAALGGLRRLPVRRNCTKAAPVVELKDGEGDGGAGVKGVAEWNEEFHSVCCLTSHREIGYQPWEVAFCVYDSNVELNNGLGNKTGVIGTVSFNMAAVVAEAKEKKIEMSFHLSTPGVSSTPSPSLYLSIGILELRTSQISQDTAQRCIIPVLPLPVSRGEASPEKDELSAIKAGLRKVKIITGFVSNRKATKSCKEDKESEGRYSTRSEESEYNYACDTESLDDDPSEGELDNENDNSVIRKSFNYGTLATVNYIDKSFYSEVSMNEGYEDWIYHGYDTPDVDSFHASYVTSNDEQPLQTSKRSILPWKRKMSFRSPKPRGEPLLKKAYEEDGGDDIDFDRRQLGSSGEFGAWRRAVDNVAADNVAAEHPHVSEFGDDNFAVGSWETKDVVSRDGHLKLSTQMFFASIDQRSERAAGGSACTVLVAVIADWFHGNTGALPVRSQFDSLIRDGSLEWRNLCEDAAYRERFPDMHFDLDTVLRANIRPLSVAQEKSFVGFFDPEVAPDQDKAVFDVLAGAMSFDGIWDEIGRAQTTGRPSEGARPSLYIVSWNDHFFLLKVDADAYYVVDTLGERLYEGCNQAHILKFDENTTITAEPPERVGSGDGGEKKEATVCRGKDACKEYIKSFLAAIPVRELQADVRKGLVPSTCIVHRRLQIEFHYTRPLERLLASPPPPTPSPEAAMDPPETGLEHAAAFALAKPSAADPGLAVV